MYNYLFIIIIFIILVCLVKKNNDFFKMNDTKWKKYRLGDIVRVGRRLGTNPHKYPNSLGDIYIKKNKTKKKNLKLFFKIVDEEIKKRKIKQNHISLHFRMGDIIYEKRTTEYTTNLDKLKLLLIKLKKNKVITSKIIINVYYGFHQLINRKTKNKSLEETNLKLVIKKNNEYQNKFRQIFKDLNIKYKEVKSGNPDLDYLEMANSKHFIQSGGGFSRLIANYVKHRGNIVYHPNSM